MCIRDSTAPTAPGAAAAAALAGVDGRHVVAVARRVYQEAGGDDHLDRLRVHVTNLASVRVDRFLVRARRPGRPRLTQHVERSDRQRQTALGCQVDDRRLATAAKFQLT